MSNVLDRTPQADDQAAIADEALDEVFSFLRANMKPKAAARARAKLEAFADRLETWQGCRLPSNVTPLWPRRDGSDQARASEVQRLERALKAEAIRKLIGRAF